MNVNLSKLVSNITRAHREALNKHKAFTLWFTGLSSAGKSTIAIKLEDRLFSAGYHIYVLDGDVVRRGVNSDLSFSKKDRAENIRRVAQISKLFNDAGIIVIAAFISPFEQDRLTARNIIGNDNFIEVFIDSSLEICKQRDPKGLYKRAINGEIEDFTGISSPYEPPLSPDVHLHTDTSSPDECVDYIINWLNTNNRYKL